MLAGYYSAAVDWLAGLPPAVGAVLFFGLFVVANTALVPASLMTVTAGMTFGFSLALPICALARPGAAACGWALARTILHKPVMRRAQHYPKLAAVDRAIEGGGLRVVLLLRLSPLFPSTPTNYLLGVTRLRFAPFILGSAVGTLPSTLLGVSAGAGLAALADSEGQGPSTLEKALLVVGLLATVGLIAMVYRAAKRELALILAEPPPSR